jgi:hypothetical protein
MGQSEYALYDKMITWGWTHIDDHLPQCDTTPLLNPKLSEKTLKPNYLEKIKSPKKINMMCFFYLIYSTVSRIFRPVVSHE